MVTKYLSSILIPYDESRTVAELQADAIANDTALANHYEYRLPHDTWYVDGVFPIAETLTDVNALRPHAMVGRNTGHTNMTSGFVMMYNQDIVHLTKPYGLFGNDGGAIGLKHHSSVVRDEALDLTTDIARDVVNVNESTYSGNHHIDEAQLLVDQLAEENHTHDLINDGNGRGIVVGAGAGIYTGDDNSDENHVNTLRSRANVEVIDCVGVAIDYQDGAWLKLEFLVFNAAYGLVIRGGRWDTNHYHIMGSVTNIENNPLYIEGNHGAFGTEYINATRYTTNSGFIDMKYYNCGKPSVVHGAPQSLHLFAEQGGQQIVNGVYQYRFGNYCPVVIMPTASGIKMQVVGDTVDPIRTGNFTIAASDIGLRYGRYPGLIKQEPVSERPVVYSVKNSKGAKFDVDANRNILTSPHFSNEAYVGFKASPGTALSGDFTELSVNGEEVVVQQPVAPFQPISTNFSDGTLQGWSPASLSFLDVVIGSGGGNALKAVHSDGLYDRAEYIATGLTVGNNYRATFYCYVEGPDPLARFGSWVGATISDVDVLANSSTQKVIDFVADAEDVTVRYYIDNDKAPTTDAIYINSMVIEEV